MCFYLILLLWYCLLLAESDNLYVSLNTVRCRPTAMGGAFITMIDDLAALSYNPAGFNLTGEAKKTPTFFINPAGAVLAIVDNESYSDRTVPVSLIFTGVGLKWGRVQIGFLPGEESWISSKRLNRDRFYDLSDYANNRNVIGGFSISLAPKVSIGAAGELFIRNAGLNAAYLGHRYGIIVHPRHNVTVGVCYFDIPNIASDERMTLDRFSDETLNLGISYRPANWLLVAGDVRNVSDEGKGDAVEPHFGMEIAPLSHLFLRGGTYHVFGTGESSYAAGFGIDDFLSFLSGDRLYSRVRVRLEATFLYQKLDIVENRWFFTAFQIIF